MAKRPSAAAYRTLLQEAIAENERVVRNLSDSDNPQVKEVLMKCEIRAEAYRAALDAFDGKVTIL